MGKENQITTQKNQELTGNQQKRLEEIAKAGDFSPVGFAKKLSSFEKIRVLKSEDEFGTRQLLGLILTKAANLIGIKDPIDEINKSDIRQMVFIKYSNLSLEAIDCAFRHDRYSGNPIEHFQLFNAEYVGKVLSRYMGFITQTMKDNNIPIAPVVENNEPTPEEKEKIHEEFLQMVFMEIRNDKISDSAWLLWDQIKNSHGKPNEVLKRLFRIQRMKFMRARPKGFDFIKGGKKSVQNICRSIVVSNYLRNHLSSFQEFKNALHEA